MGHISLRIRLYVLRIQDYPDPFLFFSDGIATQNILFDREGSGLLGDLKNKSQTSWWFQPIWKNMLGQNGNLPKLSG